MGGVAVASENLIEDLLALSDGTAQRRYLQEHSAQFDDGLATALKKQADQLLRADVQRSIEVAELLIYLGRVNGNPLHRALGLLALANARSIGLGEYQAGLELYEEADRIYRDQDRLVDQARSQIGKLWALANLGRYAQALEIGRWAGHILEEHAEWQTLAVLTMNLGIVHSRAGDDARSLEMFDRAEALYRRLGAEGEPVWLLVQQNRGVALRTLGRFEESIQAAQAAWEGLSRLGQKVEAARARQNLALTYFIVGSYNESLAHLDYVRDVFLADGRQRDAMRVELFISDCLLQLRRYHEVLEKCQQVRRLFTELGTRDVVAHAIVNEAAAYAELGRYSEALASLAEARQVFEQAGNRSRVAFTDMESAAILLRQDRWAEALALARACFRVFRDYELPVEEAQARLVAARAALALERHAQARRLVTEALEIAEKRNLPTLKYQGYHLLGTLAVARGNLRQALAEFDRAIQEVERLRGRLMLEYRVNFFEDKTAIYEDLVELCLTLDQPLRGLEYAERAKSRSLLDLLAFRLDLSIRAREAADQPLVEELAGLRARRDQVCRRWESDGEIGQRGWTSALDERGQAQQEVQILERRITELWHTLLIRNADYARDAALWTVRSEAVQPYLAPDTMLIEYFVVRGQPVAFLVTTDRVQARRLNTDLPRLQTLMQFLWLNLRAVPKSDPGRLPELTANAKGLLRQFYTSVIEPLADEVRAFPRLIVVPHGPLHYLPFHALHDGTSFLVEHHQISYLPSASFLRYCQHAELEDSGMVAVGNSNRGQLPYALQEADAIAQLLQGRTLLEERATIAAVQEALPHYRILHLATHCDFRPDNPLFSGLALADGWLTTLDIFNLRLRASLVTLSACQTGRNVVGGGDELLGLMRSFLGAGAASLVLTLWAVEDRSTAQLMEMFYRKLAEGWRKGDALRYAQLELLREGEDEKHVVIGHPYFWAPFFLVGDPGPL